MSSGGSGPSAPTTPETSSSRHTFSRPSRPFSPSPPKETRHTASRPPSLYLGAALPLATVSVPDLSAFDSLSDGGKRNTVSGLPRREDRYSSIHDGLARYNQDAAEDVFGFRDSRSRKGSRVGQPGEIDRATATAEIAIPRESIGMVRSSSSVSTTSSASPPLGSTSILAALATSDSASTDLDRSLPSSSHPRHERISAPPHSFPAQSASLNSGKSARTSLSQTFHMPSSKSMPRLHQPTVVRSLSGRGLAFVPPPSIASSSSSTTLARPRASRASMPPSSRPWSPRGSDDEDYDSIFSGTGRGGGRGGMNRPTSYFGELGFPLAHPPSGKASTGPVDPVDAEGSILRPEVIYVHHADGPNSAEGVATYVPFGSEILIEARNDRDDFGRGCEEAAGLDTEALELASTAIGVEDEGGAAGHHPSLRISRKDIDHDLDHAEFLISGRQAGGQAVDDSNPDTHPSFTAESSEEMDDSLYTKLNPLCEASSTGPGRSAALDESVPSPAAVDNEMPGRDKIPSDQRRIETDFVDHEESEGPKAGAIERTLAQGGERQSDIKHAEEMEGDATPAAIDTVADQRSLHPEADPARTHTLDCRLPLTAPENAGALSRHYDPPRRVSLDILSTSAARKPSVKPSAAVAHPGAYEAQSNARGNLSQTEPDQSKDQQSITGVQLGDAQVSRVDLIEPSATGPPVSDDPAQQQLESGSGRNEVPKADRPAGSSSLVETVIRRQRSYSPQQSDDEMIVRGGHIKSGGDVAHVQLHEVDDSQNNEAASTLIQAASPKHAKLQDPHDHPSSEVTVYIPPYKPRRPIIYTTPHRSHSSRLLAPVLVGDDESFAFTLIAGVSRRSRSDPLSLTIPHVELHLAWNPPRTWLWVPARRYIPDVAVNYVRAGRDVVLTDPGDQARKREVERQRGIARAIISEVVGRLPIVWRFANWI